MKKVLMILSLLFALTCLASCGGGGDSGGGGSSPSAADLIGTWVMSSNDGQTCTGCVVLVLKAGGAATITDTQGIILGGPGKVNATYTYDGSMLHLRGAGFEFDGTVTNYTGNSVVIGFATFVRG